MLACFLFACLLSMKEGRKSGVIFREEKGWGEGDWRCDWGCERRWDGMGWDGRQ